MKSYSIKTILFCVFLCSGIFIYGQSTLKLKKGEVIDSLTVPSSEGSNYSIYLPKSFDLNKSWPILFGFDSNNNSNKITTLFSKAAEELGFVVVVTNFSEKSSINDKSKYVAFFMEHIFNLFPIQKRRVYVVGIGNDGPLNSLLPLIYEEFNGVIAVGNSYYYNESVKVRRDFSYIGMVGNKNYRYQDFFNTKKYLRRRAVISDIYTYEGNEELPSEDLMVKALTSFTLQDMLKGKIQTDSIWVKNIFKKNLEEVTLLKSQGKYVIAYDELTRMRDRYRLFFDVDQLKEEQKGIRKINSYKKEKRLRSKYHNREKLLRETFILSLEEDIELNQYDNLGWWQYRMNELDELGKSKEKYATNMVLRIKDFLKKVLVDYKTDTVKEEKEIDKKIFVNILSTIVDKNDFESYRKIISLSAIDQDNSTALFYLEKMLQNGYKELESLYNIEGTLALRISKEYNNIIKKYLGTSKYFTFN
ncbi:hypothetical protein [uncultured Aquimarina sp.]|uniref:hypothetical protein n=1 Tax=uncultured Aquimarina sp. TaxID=575652 RepID=UPI00260E8729|nr:hypothetical protein [uncultured Aquimarina sp.]